MNSMKYLATVVLCIVAYLNLSVQANNMTFNDFADTTSLTLNGSATTVTTPDGTVLRLTPASTSKSGSAFSTESINASNFSSFFKFRISGAGGSIFGCNTKPGADGLVFVVQSVSSSIGGGGVGIGYAGINNSVGVEFDTWCNASENDPNSNHIGIDTKGSVNHGTNAPATVKVTPDFDDGNLWYVWVDYDGVVLEVRANQTGIRPETATIAQTIDIPTLLGQEKMGKAYVGFTSGTGSDYGNHDIISWEYRDSFDPVVNDNTQPSTTCMATYTREGRLHIPYVTVPGVFGGTRVYDVYMQQKFPSFIFELDMEKTKPR